MAEARRRELEIPQNIAAALGTVGGGSREQRILFQYCT
jgi:hypothetical protein